MQRAFSVELGFGAESARERLLDLETGEEAALLEPAVGRIGSLKVTGGLAKRPFITQLYADVLERELEVSPTPEATTRGRNLRRVDGGGTRATGEYGPGLSPQIFSMPIGTTATGSRFYLSFSRRRHEIWSACVCVGVGLVEAECHKGN